MKFILFLLLSLSVNCNATGIPVLVYHQVTNDKSPGSTVISIDRFNNQMNFLNDNGYKTLSIKELVDIMDRKSVIKEKLIVVTFDDGWNSELNAIPVLSKFNMKASFQIIANSYNWPDYLTLDQIKNLLKNPNFEIQSHTLNHPWKPDDNLVSWDEKNKSSQNVIEEIKESKIKLEHDFSRKIDFIAWPAGYFNEHLLDIAIESGYVGSMMAWGEVGNNPGDDSFKIKRIVIDGNCSIEEFDQIILSGNSTICQMK